MYYQYKKITNIDSAELDNYLAKGWYRLMQELIRLDEYYENDYYWLRLNLSKAQLDKSQKRVLNYARRFNIELSNWSVNEEIETLWSHYSTCANFEALDTAAEYLFGEQKDYNLFDTKMITIRDAAKLIAVGYFDLGKCAVTSILHFYHPDYRKFSLGKLLLLLEIEYAKHNGFVYYYTGYISLFNTKYDYKLFCGKNATEVYLPKEDKWEAYSIVEKDGLMKKYDIDAQLSDKLSLEEELYLIEQIEKSSKKGLEY